MKEKFSIKDPLSIYIHIPFCMKKCGYCDFLSAPAGKERQEEYVHALLGEIAYWGSRLESFRIKSVYFGGGTPSVLQEELLIEILCKLRKAFPGIGTRTIPEGEFGEGEPEISIEVNPGTITGKKLKAYKQAGINRLSIGLQSADNQELKLLGRIHTYEEFLETYAEARKQGFSNLNIDLISALPGQKVKSWQDTLEKVLALKPEHISAYSLMIEEGTPFYEIYYGREGLLPDEETDRAMYVLTKEMLKGAGYERYEISNYSRKGMECRHNMVYWQRGYYLGLGLGSASMIENIRFRNTERMEDYVNFWGSHEKAMDESIPGEAGIPSICSWVKEVCRDIQCLTVEEQMEEFLFLGLRMIQGVSVKEFEAAFGKSIFEIYGEQIEKYKKQQMLTVSDRIALTDRGLDVSNLIFSDFLLSV